jgi:tRNA pseudouridine55 synthase
MRPPGAAVAAGDAAMAASSAPRRTWRRVDGVLLLDKPSGLSSNAALQRARRVLQAEKGGHTGTLDPLASGLLALCFGEATKFAQFLLDADKGYRATVRFGVTTDTLDAEGTVLSAQPVALDQAALEGLLAASLGTQMQTPPAHAALKYRGRAYYEYARAGEAIPRAPREVRIDRLTLVSFVPPDAIVDVACGKGTYVRVIAADLGERAGCGAHLAALRRTRTAGFDVKDAISLEALEARPDEAAGRLLPVDVLVAHLPRADVEPSAAAAFLHGQAVAVPVAPGPCRVYGEGRLLGVAEVAGGLAQPRRSLAAPL